MPFTRSPPQCPKPHTPAAAVGGPGGAGASGDARDPQSFSLPGNDLPGHAPFSEGKGRSLAATRLPTGACGLHPAPRAAPSRSGGSARFPTATGPAGTRGTGGSAPCPAGAERAGPRLPRRRGAAPAPGVRPPRSRSRSRARAEPGATMLSRLGALLQEAVGAVGRAGSRGRGGAGSGRGPPGRDPNGPRGALPASSRGPAQRRPLPAAPLRPRRPPRPRRSPPLLPSASCLFSLRPAPSPQLAGARGPPSPNSFFLPVPRSPPPLYLPPPLPTHTPHFLRPGLKKRCPAPPRSPALRPGVRSAAQPGQAPGRVQTVRWVGPRPGPGAALGGPWPQPWSSLLQVSSVDLTLP